MYRITEEIARHLLENSKNADIPGLTKTDDKPFVAQNIYSIGCINDTFALNTDALYLVETDPTTQGFYLYKKGELSKPNDVIEVARNTVDPYVKNEEEILDISDCAIELPSQTEKLTTKRVADLNRIFELEPDIKKCLLK